MNSPVELLRGLWRSARLIALLLVPSLQTSRIAQADAATQARWRKRWLPRILRLMHVRLHVQGTVPPNGLLVSNHLGYLDVLVYGSLIEGSFLSKAEVEHWPLLGRLTQAVGTLFVQRDSMRSTAEANRQIAARLEQCQQVLLFPEGTSTGGTTVLAFQTPFFDAPQRTGAPVWPAAIHYTAQLSHGTVAERVCYWGDMVIGPHLFGLLCIRSIDAYVRFADAPLTAADRRTTAAQAHTAVEDLYRQLRSGS